MKLNLDREVHDCHYRLIELRGEVRNQKRLLSRQTKVRQRDLVMVLPPTVRVHERGATLVTGWETPDGIKHEMNTAL